MPPIFAIVGPTATGKSDLAMRLARELDGEIINADALQVYRGFDLGTAKPSPEEQAEIPHHLIDILDPRERYSAGEFARRARLALEQIEARGRAALVVGGSGLYIRALFEGISPIPPGDPKIRRRLRQRLDEEGLEVLQGELSEVDPVTAGKINDGDAQRVLRGLEVALATGRPLSSWVASRPFGSEPLPAVKVGLTLPREVLYDQIERRARKMVAEGWLDEIQRILAAGVPVDAPAFQAIGYRQLLRHVGGEWSLEQALSATIQATRRFAKRQMTWFRKEPGIRWLPAQDLTFSCSQLLSVHLVRDLGGSNGEAQH
ncbi:MAG: tRNA (adenosine(37)-N6)-dimethylallyltransferase MiaA [Acidobacteriota bacterium]|nr:tRNA (adenosine(37)-N6)-dimethylallyltransferase MiaA [Acidobacteriota bacterium]